MGATLLVRYVELLCGQNLRWLRFKQAHICIIYTTYNTHLFCMQKKMASQRKFLLICVTMQYALSLSVCVCFGWLVGIFFTSSILASWSQSISILILIFVCKLKAWFTINGVADVSVVRIMLFKLYELNSLLMAVQKKITEVHTHTHFLVCDGDDVKKNSKKNKYKWWRTERNLL